MAPEPASLRVPRVAAARRLAKRAFRARDRRFLAEGPQAVREALALPAGSPGAPVELFLTAEADARHPELARAATAAGCPVHRVGGEVTAALSETVTPQGAVAVCTFLDRPVAEVLTPGLRLVVVMAAVRDPGNAGTVIRCADAAGADAVVLTDASVDVYNGKCVRASAGSLFHLPIVVGAPVDELAGSLRAAGLHLLAADGAGPDDLDDLLDDGLLARPTAWILGNEAWGLPAATAALADAVVRVPVYGGAESLNLATAAAVCLYASARAQRTAAG